MTDHASKVCSQCRQELPLTSEFFYFRKSSGSGGRCADADMATGEPAGAATSSGGGWWAGVCRKCQAANATERERKRSRRQGIAVDDGLQGSVRETQRIVRTAFGRMDPGGRRTNDLLRRLQCITHSFGNLAIELRAEAIGKWIPEFLKGRGSSKENAS